MSAVCRQTWLTKAPSSDTLQNGNLQHVIPGAALLHGGEASVSAVLKLAELQHGPASTDMPHYRHTGHPAVGRTKLIMQAQYSGQNGPSAS